MAFVIAVTLPKGGVGKTTIAHALAAAAAALELSVVILDRDSQGSSYSWASRADEAGAPLPYPVFVASGPEITRWLNRYGDEWDVVIIDGHLEDDDHNRAATRAAAMVCVPTKPYEVDFERIYPWLDYCRSVDTPATVVLSMVPANANDGAAARETLQEQGITVAETELSHRVGIARSYGARPGRLLTQIGHRLLNELTP